MTQKASPLLVDVFAFLTHWRRHKLQFMTLVVGLASATALWTAVQALNTHARASYDRSAATLQAFERTSLVAIDRAPIREQVFADLRRSGTPVIPLVEGRLGPPGEGVRLVGIDPLSYGTLGGTGIAVPQGTDMLAFLEPPGLLFAETETAARLSSLFETMGLANRPAVEIRTTLATGQALGDIAVVQSLLGLEGRLSRLLLPDNYDISALKLPAPWGERLEVTEPPVRVDLDGLTDSFHLNLTAFGLLCFLVGLFIVYAAIGLAVEDRLHALRTLRICGVSRRKLLLTMILEMTGIATLAGLAGVAGGYVIAALLLPDVAASLRGLYGAQVAGSLQLDAAWWLGGVGISILGALGAAIGAFIKTSNMALLESRNVAAWRSKQAKIVLFQSVFGIFFVLIALFLHWFGSGLTAAFLQMASILLGAAFLLPGVLLLLVTIGKGTAKSPLSQWFWADSRQQLSGLSLALMALLLALGTNIGVSGMVEGFRRTFDAFLEERLSADLYVLAASNQEAGRAIAWATQNPDITAVLPIWDATATVGDNPVNVVGFTDHTSYRDTWTLLEKTEDPWADTTQKDGVLINEQLHYRAGLAVGETLTLDSETGPLVRIVAGIYSDYGNPRSEVRLANRTLETYWPSGERRRIALHAQGDISDVAAQLTKELGIPADRTINQLGLKAFSRAVFEKTFAVSAALNTLTLGVAGIALITSLLTLAGARLTGVAPLWAMGVRRRTITCLEGLKILLLALFTSLAAIPLGVAISWCLVAVINVEAFGWRLPLHVFPDQWMILVMLGLMTALIASLYPLWRLWRTPPADLSKVFAHEH